MKQKKSRMTLIVTVLFLFVTSLQIAMAENMVTEKLSTNREIDKNEEIIIFFGEEDYELHLLEPEDSLASLVVMNENEIALLDIKGRKIMLFVNGEWKNNISLNNDSVPVDMEYANGCFFVLDVDQGIYIYSMKTGQLLHVVDASKLGGWATMLETIDGVTYVYVDGEYHPVTIDLDRNAKNCQILERENSISQPNIITNKVNLDSVLEKSKKTIVRSTQLAEITANTYHRVCEVANTETLLQEISIVKMNQQNEIVAKYIINQEDCRNFALDFVRLDTQGNVYTIYGYDNYACIKKINLEDKIDNSMLQQRYQVYENEKTEKESKQSNEAKAYETISLTRAAVNTNSIAHLSASFMVNLVNATNTFANTQLPSYVRSATSFPLHRIGVPYCFGGWATASQMTSSLAQGKLFGNVNTTAVSSQTTGASSQTTHANGTDCSGLVSRVYGYTGKVNTTTLYNKNYGSRNWGSICKMDYAVGLKSKGASSNHVRLFNSRINDTTVNVVESTTSDGIDKVVQRSITQAAFSNYVMKSPWSSGHQFDGSKWLRDSQNHWHGCGSNCKNFVMDEQSHVFGSGSTCSVCAYKK